MNNTAVLKEIFELKLKTFHIFLFILGVTLINTWLYQNYIITPELYHNLYYGKLEYYRIEEMFFMGKKLSYWSYIAVAPLLLLRLTFVALLLQLPIAFKFVDIKFTSLFRITLIALLPLTLMAYVQLIRLMNINPADITEQTMIYVPLAITNILDYENIPKHIYTFLSSLNMFEVGWLICIAVGLYKTDKLKKLDVVLITLGVWTVLLVLQFLFMSYLNKINS